MPLRARRQLPRGYVPLHIPTQHVLRRDTQARHTGAFDVPVQAFDRDFVLHLQPARANLFSDGARMRVHNEHGVVHEEVLDHRDYFSGSVSGDPQSFCHFRIEANGRMRGLFVTSTDGFYIDPVEDHFFVEGEPSDFNHIMYRDSVQPHNVRNVSLDEIKSTTFETVEDVAAAATQSRGRRSGPSGPYVNGQNACRIALVIDSTFYINSATGNSNPAQARDGAFSRFEVAATIFRATGFTNVKNSINVQTTMELQVFSLDIYETAGEDPFDTITDGSDYLNAFSASSTLTNLGHDWNDVCLVHLMTNKG